MKKRMLALAIAGVLVLGNCVAVFAEETEGVTEAAEAAEVQEYTLDDFDDTLYEGSWVSFEAGFDLYLPTDWNVLEISDDETAQGIVFHAAAPDESGRNLVVNGAALEKEYTPDDIEAELNKSGYTNTSQVIINDIPVVSYQTDEAMGCAFTANEGTVMYNIVFAPASDEEFGTLAQNIMISLSATEEAAEGETEAVTE